MREANSAFDELRRKGEDAVKGVGSAMERLRDSIFSIKGAITALGVGALAKSFLDAGRETENYQVRLRVLLGSVAEGKRLFDDMNKYAATSVFTFRDVMGAATQLAGVLKGGVNEIKGYMPLIGDLAAASGLGIQEATGQVVKMLSAGAQAADSFREKGILSMTGFQAGVTYSAEQTRKKLIESWESATSKFRGASEALVNTWDGAVGMLEDAWFQFQQRVMVDGGVLAYLRAIVQVLTDRFTTAFGAASGASETFARNTISGFEGVVRGIGAVIEASKFLGVMWEGLKTAASGISLAWSEISLGAEKLSLDKAIAEATRLRYAWDEAAKSGNMDDLARTDQNLAAQLELVYTKQQQYNRTLEQTTRKESDNSEQVEKLFASYKEFEEGVDLHGFLNDVNAQFEKNKKASDAAAEKLGKFNSGLKDFAGNAGGVDKAAIALNQGLGQTADMLDRLRGAIDPVAKAETDYEIAVRNVIEQEKKNVLMGESVVASLTKIKLAREYAAKARDQELAAIAKERDIIGRLTKDYSEETRLAGLSEKQRAIVTETIKAENMARELNEHHLRTSADLTAEERDQVAALAAAHYDEVRALQLAADATKEQQDMIIRSLDGVGDALGKLFAGGLKDWKGFWKSLKDIAKNYLADLVSFLFHQNIVIPIQTQFINGGSYGYGGGAGGGGFLGMLGSLFGGGGGAGGGGGYMQAAGSMMGGGGGSTSFGGLGNIGGLNNIGSMFGFTGAGGSIASWFGGGAGASGGMVGLGGGAGNIFATSSVPYGGLGGPAYLQPGLGGGVGGYGSPALGGVGTLAAGLGGAYYGYQHSQGGAAGVGAAASYGALGIGVAGTAAGLMGGASLGAAVGGAYAGIASAAWIPVVGWILAALAVIDLASGGKLFGTKFKPKSYDQILRISEQGGTAALTAHETRQRALFGGTASRDRSINPGTEAQQQAGQAFSQVEDAADSAGFALGVAGQVAAGEFHRVLDKKGKNVKEEFSLVNGQKIHEKAEDFMTRMIAEARIKTIDAFLASLGAANATDGLAAVSTEAFNIAAKWRGSADELDAGSKFLLAAAVDMKNGANLLGDGATLTEIDNVIETLAHGGEDLSDAYTRIKGSADLWRSVLDGLNIAIEGTGAAFVEFASKFADAAGGLDKASQLTQSFFDNYFTPVERLQIQTKSDEKLATRAVGDLGDSGEGLTFENFRQRFTDILPSLSPEQVAKWMEAGAALAKLHDDIMKLGQAGGSATDLLTPLRSALASYNTVFDTYQGSLANATQRMTQSTTDILGMTNSIMSRGPQWGSAEDSEATLLSMLQQRYQMEIAYIREIDQAAQHIGDTLSQSIEDIRTSQMNPEGKYNYYRDQADTLAAGLANMTDPAEIERTIDRINDLQKQAWGTLTEDQQHTLAQGFIDFLTKVQGIANDQLTSAREQTGADHETIAEAIQKAMDRVSARQESAATRQEAAAETMQFASNTFAEGTTVSVVVTGNGGESGEVGGGRDGRGRGRWTR